MSAEPESGADVRLRIASPAQETLDLSTREGNHPEDVEVDVRRESEDGMADELTTGGSDDSGRRGMTVEQGKQEGIEWGRGGEKTEERFIEGGGNEKFAGQTGAIENAGNQCGGLSAQPLSFGGEQSGGQYVVGSKVVGNVIRDGQATSTMREVESHDSGGQDVVAMDGEDKEDVAIGRVVEVSESGGHGAQVILLAAAHHKSRQVVGGPLATGNSASVDEFPSDRIAQWLKSILPDVSDGWWEPRAAGQGLSLKFRFRWSDQTRQTIGFPRLTRREFIDLKNAGDEEARRMICERIAGHLRMLSLHPAKREKALVAAQKLGIALAMPDMHNVHTFKIN